MMLMMLAPLAKSGNAAVVQGRFLPIFPTLLWLQSLSNAGNVGADLPPQNSGLKHGQPARRTVSKVLHGFP